MAGKRGRSGGARLGAGRKSKSYMEAVASGEIKPRSKCEAHVFRDGPYGVYVVHEVGHPVVCKIGIAERPQKRFSALQVGSWRELTMAHQFMMPGERIALAVERAVHTALAPRHCRGEWYSVTPDEAADHVIEAALNLGVELLGEHDAQA